MTDKALTSKEMLYDCTTVILIFPLGINTVFLILTFQEVSTLFFIPQWSSVHVEKVRGRSLEDWWQVTLPCCHGDRCSASVVPGGHCHNRNHFPIRQKWYVHLFHLWLKSLRRQTLVHHHRRSPGVSRVPDWSFGGPPQRSQDLYLCPSRPGPALNTETRWSPGADAPVMKTHTQKLQHLQM